jgi:hypothetical protein
MVFVKRFHELLLSANSYEAIMLQVNSLAPELRASLGITSWSLDVEGYGTSLEPNKELQRARKQEMCDVLALEGPVALRNPSNKLVLMEIQVAVDGEVQKHLHESDGEPSCMRMAAADINQPSPKSAEGRAADDAAPARSQWFFVRQLGEGCQQLLKKLSLKKRSYLGPTSLDAELSLLMCNQVHARRGSMLLDPYCGSGSLLLAGAALGAFVVGGDIDFCMLTGKGEGRKAKRSNGGKLSILSGFDTNGWPRPEVLCLDMAKQRDCLCFSPKGSSSACISGSSGPGDESMGTVGTYDAIATDPPYGLRAGARTLGRPEGVVNKPIAAHMLATHIKPTVPYAPECVLDDLLQFAATQLKVGGRLAYLSHGHGQNGKAAKAARKAAGKMKEEGQSRQETKTKEEGDSRQESRGGISESGNQRGVEQANEQEDVAHAVAHVGAQPAKQDAEALAHARYPQLRLISRQMIPGKTIRTLVLMVRER